MTNDMNKIIARNVHMARTHLRKMSLLRLSLRCFSAGLKLSQRDILKLEAGERDVTMEDVNLLAEALMVNVAYLIIDRPEEWARARALRDYTPRSVPDAAERAIDGLAH